MDLNQFRTAIRLKIDDNSATRFTDEQLKEIVNQSIRKIYSSLLEQNIYTNKLTEEITVVANVRETELSLTRIMQKPIRLEDASSYDINFGREEHIIKNYNYNYNYPEAYFAFKNGVRVIGWNIIPASADTFILHYAPVPKTYGEDTTVLNDIPVEYHDIIATYAVVLLLGIDEENYKFWASIYQDELKTMVQAVALDNPVGGEVTDVNYSY